MGFRAGLLAAGLALFAPVGAAAETQGALGPTSTGSQNVTLTVVSGGGGGGEGGQVRISGLVDLAFPDMPEGFEYSLAARSNACFYHSSPSFSLTISRTTNPEAGPGLKLVSPSGDEIPVAIRVATGFMVWQGDFIDGVSRTGMTGNQWSQDCSELGGGWIEYYQPTPLSESLAPVGTYSGGFQITLAAE